MVYTSISPTEKREEKESPMRCVDNDTSQTPSSSACNLSHRAILSATCVATRAFPSHLPELSRPSQGKSMRTLASWAILLLRVSSVIILARAEMWLTTSRDKTDTSCRACNAHSRADRDAICTMISATCRVRMSEEAYTEKPARQWWTIPVPWRNLEKESAWSICYRARPWYSISTVNTNSNPCW